MEHEHFWNAVLAVQAELRANKDQYNQFGGYKYRSAESILAAVKPLLSKHGLIINLSDELLMIGDPAPTPTTRPTILTTLRQRSAMRVSRRQRNAAQRRPRPTRPKRRRRRQQGRGRRPTKRRSRPMWRHVPTSRRLPNTTRHIVPPSASTSAILARAKRNCLKR